jgi:hypothetical protein
LALSVFLLSAPGLLFNLGRRLAGRISQRQTRDFLSAFGELIFLSIPLTILIAWVANMLFCGLSWGVINSFALLPELTPELRVALLKQVLILIALGFGVCMLAGLAYGSCRTWFSWFGFGERLPLEKLLTGFVRPGAFATVVTTTKLDKGVLVYRGFVESLQMSPEGNIDFIALLGPEKAYLSEPILGPPKSSSFSSIVEGAISESQSISALIIESEDIANLLLTKIPSAGSPNWLEFILYIPVRLVSLLLAAPKRLFFPRSKTKNSAS